MEAYNLSHLHIESSIPKRRMVEVMVKVEKESKVILVCLVQKEIRARKVRTEIQDHKDHKDHKVIKVKRETQVGKD